MADRSEILCWLHIGDLHITRAGRQNHRDLLRIVALTQKIPADSVDFAILPGDNADDGMPEQFGLVRGPVAGLPMKLHVPPGDHDFKTRALDAFHAVLGAGRLPKSLTVRGHRCLLLDVVPAGSGGPDFRLDQPQLAWLRRELDQAEAAGRTVAVFMATRSTGQIEEGPPGFSFAAIDGGGVSWRFKTLEQPWPFVLITAPADRRLVTSHTPSPMTQVRAKVIGDAPIETVDLKVDDGAWIPMAPGPASVWQASAPHGARVTVRARDAAGRTDHDTAEPAGPEWTPRNRHAGGSDADRIGACPGKGILGTHLGPNRNGHPW